MALSQHSVDHGGYGAIPPTPAHIKRQRVVVALILMVLFALTLLSLVTLGDVSWERVVRGFRNNLPPLVRGFANPSADVLGVGFVGGQWVFDGNLAVGRMLESLYMAIIGTVIGGILAVPIAFISAANLTGSQLLTLPGKGIQAAIRTFPELLFGIIFVASFGPGALAGIMALGINSIGFLGKVFSDIIEGIDPGPSEAIRATGGNALHVFVYSVVPQVLPEFASYVLYRFEINLRAAAVLGLVGAGGIGTMLTQRITFRRWDQVSTILMVIVAFVIVVDLVSSYVRKRLV
jgi:phosphonate transport system permease protein